MGGSSVLAFSTLGFRRYHRHTGAIHLDIKDGDARPNDDRQIELDRTLDLGSLALCDVFSNRFGLPFDSLPRHGEARQ